MRPVFGEQLASDAPRNGSALGCLCPGSLSAEQPRRLDRQLTFLQPLRPREPLATVETAATPSQSGRGARTWLSAAARTLVAEGRIMRKSIVCGLLLLAPLGCGSEPTELEPGQGENGPQGTLSPQSAGPAASPPPGPQPGAASVQEDVGPLPLFGGEPGAATAKQADTDGAPGQSKPEGTEPAPKAQGGEQQNDAEAPMGGKVPSEAMPPKEAVDLGAGDGSDVVTIGDSWMSFFANRGGIEGALRRAGKNYRNYGVAATTLAGSIPGQFTRAKRNNPEISTVIMTGGGNDILFTGGCNTAAQCGEAVVTLVENLNELWTQMADDGVQNIVYIQYASDAGSRARPDEPPPVAEICLSGRVRCHSLATTELVDGALIDGIHPSSAANERIAAAVLELMEARGIRR